MEIKKIVEGMTAPQVAKVIEDNFNEADKKKADKTELSELGSKVNDIITDKEDCLYLIDNDGNAIMKVDQNGLDAIVSQSLKNKMKIDDVKDDEYTDTLYVIDSRGNVMLSIGQDGLNAVLCKKILELVSKQSSWLCGKTFVALGASLSISGYWQKSFAENSGGIFLEDVHKAIPCAFGGSATYGGENSQQDRLMKLKKHLDDNNIKLDVLLIENANDMNKINQTVNIDTDLPWLWSQTYNYDGYIASSYGDAIANFNNNTSNVLSGVTPKAGTKVNLPYSGNTSSNVKVSSAATLDGLLTLKVGGREYGISVTKGMTVKNIVDKILEWSYEGYSDVLASDKSSVDFFADAGNADVTIVSNTTGASVSISTVQAIKYVNYTYKEITTDNWTNPSSWGESWSVESLTRCYKGLLEYVGNNFPDTTVIWIGLPHYIYDFDNGAKRADGSYDVDAYMASQYNTNEDNLYILQKSICKRYRIPFVDLRENSNISLIKARMYYNNNDVHPVMSKGAYQLWGKVLSNLLN